MATPPAPFCAGSLQATRIYGARVHGRWWGRRSVVACVFIFIRIAKELSVASPVFAADKLTVGDAREFCSRFCSSVRSGNQSTRINGLCYFEGYKAFDIGSASAGFMMCDLPADPQARSLINGGEPVEVSQRACGLRLPARREGAQPLQSRADGVR